MMVNYAALILKESDDTAFGVVFPDLPGCFSAGDTYEEAVRNASEALALYCEVAVEEGEPLPPARPLTAVAEDKFLKDEFGDTIVRTISVSANVQDQRTYAHGGISSPSQRPGFEESSD